jgi:hypothetical protein
VQSREESARTLSIRSGFGSRSAMDQPLAAAFNRVIGTLARLSLAKA